MKRIPQAKSIFSCKAPELVLSLVEGGVGVLLLFLPFLTQGQLKKYSLNGIATTTSGLSYPYHVIFDINNSKLSGYSVTKQPNGENFNALITGQIDKRKHSLRITEIKALDHQSEMQTICLFDAKLTYKLIGDTYFISGTYTGHDLANNVCTDGTMEFDQLNDPASAFYKEKIEPVHIKKPKEPEKPKLDTPAIKEATVPPNTITEGVQKQIDWVSDTCVLEIWDGGVIDGDVVTVLYNDEPVLTNYTLTKPHKQLRIPLTKRKSAITIIAEDEGINPPNTADILFIDGGAYYKLTAYNKKGKKAIIIITKK